MSNSRGASRHDDRTARDQGNSGMVVGHGAVFNGPVAGGQNARVVISGGPASDDEAARLAELLEELVDGLRDLDSEEAADALDNIDRIQDELGRRKPDASRLSQLMDRITQVVVPVSGLLEVANGVRDLILAIVR